MERKTLDLKFDAGEGPGEISGYGAVFGNVDSQGDRLEKGAFATSMGAGATLPKMLWQHDSREPVGVWTHAAEDPNGLFLRGKLAVGASKGRDAYELIKAGALSGLSIGYRVVDYAMDAGVRVLKAVDLVEVSLVTVPANALAQVTAFKCGADMTEREFERAIRGMGFDRTAAKTIAADGFKGYQRHLRDAGVLGPDFDLRDADDIKRTLAETLQNLEAYNG